MTMDLAELRINRTPVTPNSKCEGCVHYDGNAQAKGGACEVGSMPSMCGSGTEPKYGYAPLAELSPDEIDDLATPTINGMVGAMNEHGSIEKTIMMKRVVLGDEDMTIAQRIAGKVSSELGKSIGFAQGEVAIHCGAELAQELYEKPLPLAYVVAKSLRDLHFAPRKQKKYDIGNVLDFLYERGMDVGDDAYAAAGITKAEGDPAQPIAARRRRQTSIGTQKIKPITNEEAAANLRAGVHKAIPNVKKVGNDPFAKRQ